MTCSDPSRKARDIHGGTVVLRDNKVRNYSPFAPSLFAPFTEECFVRLILRPHIDNFANRTAVESFSSRQ